MEQQQGRTRPHDLDVPSKSRGLDKSARRAVGPMTPFPLPIRLDDHAKHGCDPVQLEVSARWPTIPPPDRTSRWHRRKAGARTPRPSPARNDRRRARGAPKCRRTPRETPASPTLRAAATRRVRGRAAGRAVAADIGPAIRQKNQQRRVILRLFREGQIQGHFHPRGQGVPPPPGRSAKRFLARVSERVGGSRISAPSPRKATNATRARDT